MADETKGVELVVIVAGYECGKLIGTLLAWVSQSVRCIGDPLGSGISCCLFEHYFIRRFLDCCAAALLRIVPDRPVDTIAVPDLEQTGRYETAGSSFDVVGAMATVTPSRCSCRRCLSARHGRRLWRFRPRS